MREIFRGIDSFIDRDLGTDFLTAYGLLRETPIGYVVKMLDRSGIEYFSSFRPDMEKTRLKADGVPVANMDEQGRVYVPTNLRPSIIWDTESALTRMEEEYQRWHNEELTLREDQAVGVEGL